MTTIQERLFALQDTEYQAFTQKLNPTVSPDAVIGVRLPDLHRLAKELRGSEEADAFLAVLPHKYLEENHLHSMLIGEIRDFDTALREAERFFPYVDNWAVCDTLRSKAFAKTPERLLPAIGRWLSDKHPFTVRYAILCLMTYFLDERFDERYPAMVAAVKSDHYYVNMMIAWYFATALAKQYEATVPYIEENRLDIWTHNKAIQKAIESYRVSAEHKAYLRTLKRKAQGKTQT